ncbi:methyl-accepting chemotaxis protein [Paenibacillus sp. J5C_2022]|uniref:methyl-accepting chemotaxis protein n=1 Tax=Paenibacillus sp. J5C2022 TaxID=2977129 RepID=UPI0021D35240|nr:methyl-accepting chemotaxis protein [Paenibacillus sp. J5C2022]MCU6707481.1 methyl-accepting chemotaxis protein [Paenibacillus sp. J5C2022]
MKKEEAGALNKWSGSIKTKFIVFLLLMILIPSVLASWLLTSDLTGDVETELKERQLSIASSNAQALNDFLQSKVKAMEGIIEARRATFLQNDEQVVLELLESLKAMNPDIQLFSYSPVSGMSINDQGEYKDISIYDNFKRIKQDNTIGISDVIHDPENDENIIIIDIPIDTSGEFKGLLQAIVNPDHLLQNLNRNKMGETGYVYILSKEGMYLTHTSPEKIGQEYKQFATESKIKLYEETVLAEEKGSIRYTEPDGSQRLASFANVDTTDWRIVVSGNETDLMSSVQAAKQRGIWVIVICAAGASIIAYFAASLMLRPVMSISALMRHVAEGDLRERLPVKGNDELQQLNSHINGMLDSFGTALRKLYEAVEHTAVSSEQLTAISANSTRAAEQTAMTAQRMEKGARTQHEGSEQSAFAMEEMAVGITKIAESSGLVSEQAVSVHGRVSEGDEVVQSAVQQCNVASDTVSRAAMMVKELERKSEEINSIVKYISDIATQTNLLSLNASIEAARAGEHGRGFAVVAGEVKKLAEQTSHATGSIASILHEVQQSAALTSASITEGMEEVSRSVTHMDQVGAVFQSIVQSVEQVSAQIQEVSAATEELSASTEEVTASMLEIVDISKHTLQDLTSISDASQRQHQSMGEISSSSESLSRMASELQDLVAKFKV